MTEAYAGAVSPTPHYYEITGRAAEIARALGSPAGDAEHLFLGMLHDGGWPVNVISGLVDLGRAEAAVLAIINSPGYSPPPAPVFPLREGWVRPWGAEVACAMGDSHVGVEHALAAMIRSRDSVPARALADLADLDTLEAAVLEAKNAPAASPPADAVFLPEGREMDGELRRALVGALPEGTTFGFNSGDERTWVHVFGRGPAGGPEFTREVLNTALASLGRPTVDK